MFAFDSVPAVIAVLKEPFIIYSAMIFAILGLRTLYFVFGSFKKIFGAFGKSGNRSTIFHCFKLILNATNEIFAHGFEISVIVSLYTIIGILSLGIIASFVFPSKENDE